MQTQMKTNEPSKRAGVMVRTQVRAGKPVKYTNTPPDINLFDRAMFGVIDAIQKPTDWAYGLLKGNQ